MKINLEVRAEVLGAPAVVRLRYDAADPYAVAVDIPDWGCTVTWLIARDLLRHGLVHVVGEGDAVVLPGSHLVGLLLANGDVGTTVMLARGDVVEFLRAADRMVPPGTETGRLDWSDLAEVLS